MGKSKTESVKKVNSKKTIKKPRLNPEWESLAKELRSLIPKLDEDGLSFLVEQAQVHLYNMQVDALNTTLIKSQQRAAKKAGSAAKTSKEGQGKGTSNDFREIKVSESGASYYIVYKTEWIMFARNEMIKLVKIAGSAETDLDAKERLFNWFARERTDLLRSAGIANKFDNKLLTLAKMLKKHSGKI